MNAGDRQRSAYEHIKARVLGLVEQGHIDPAGPRGAVRERIGEVVRGYQRQAHLRDELVALSDPTGMVERVLAAVCDVGPLTSLLARPDVEEIMVHGNRLSYITADGRLRVAAVAAAEKEYRQWIDRLLASVNRQLDASTPIVSVGLSGGARLAVKIPPVAEELTVCIRRPVLGRPTLARLVGQGLLSAPAAELLAALMRIRSRVVIAGAPFSGKTTLANALIEAIPEHRVVRVNEEARELTAPLAHGSYCQAFDRPGQTLRDIIRADLHFRPDFLVVGEIRGAEAFEVLRPLNAGCGFLSTCHANQVRDVIDVLTQCAVMAGEQMRDEHIRSLFCTAIDFVVFVDADEPTGSSGHGRLRRQITEIAWVAPQPRGGRAVYEPIFVRDRLGGRLEWTGGQPDETTIRRIERALAGRGSLTALLEGREVAEAAR